MKTTNTGYLLSTGRTIDANKHILGLNLENKLTHGYDGMIEGYEPDFTDEEKQEIAEYMLECWADWGGIDLKSWIIKENERR